jgi:hypothetical protein
MPQSYSHLRVQDMKYCIAFYTNVQGINTDISI